MSAECHGWPNHGAKRAGGLLKTCPSIRNIAIWITVNQSTNVPAVDIRPCSPQSLGTTNPLICVVLLQNRTNITNCWRAHLLLTISVYNENQNICLKYLDDGASVNTSKRGPFLLKNSYRKIILSCQIKKINPQTVHCVALPVLSLGRLSKTNLSAWKVWNQNEHVTPIVTAT